MSKEREKLEAVMPEFCNLVRVLKKLRKAKVVLTIDGTDIRIHPVHAAMVYLDIDINEIESKEIKDLVL